jgi:uncharacterized membrane protein YbhN (UPF0104 family)
VTWKAGALLLVRVRLLDLCAVGAWILAAGVAAGGSLSPGLRGAWLLCGAGLAGAPLLLRAAPRVAKFLPGRLARPLEALGRIGRIRRAEWSESLVIWGLNGASLYATARAVSLPLTFPQVWLITTIQLPLQLVPLQGVANAGNHEAGWVAGLALLGVGRAEALAYALATHALLAGYILCLAPVALLASLRGRGLGSLSGSPSGPPGA